jgi:acid phosphatase
MQTYANATSAIDRALADSSWTAAQEQTGKFSEKSPAIIIDVDETVLDNIAFQARSILTGISYPTGWIEWGLEESAEPVPGVSNFLKHAQNKGVKIFYVTNRVVELEEATKNNLKLLGLPFDEDRDVLLMRGENGWGSSKVSRRALVAKDYRVILLVGDQLGDFISLKESTIDSQSRRKLAEKYSDMWGTKWFMLTNPMYGRWESSIYGNKYPDTKEEQIQMRIKALRP